MDPQPRVGPAPPSLDDFELRRPTPDDADVVIEAALASRDLHRGWVGPPTTPEAYADWLARTDTETDRRHLALYRGEVIGTANLQNIVRGNGQYATLGYLAFDGGEGRGLMRRAVALAVDVAFGELGLHRVEAGIQPANTRSIALVRALGFWYEGLLRGLVRVDDEWRDHELWAVTVEHWPGARALFPD